PEAQRVINAIQAEATRLWASRRAAPDPADGPSFEELVERHSGAYPVQVERTEWLDRSELLRRPLLAQAFGTVDGQRVSAANLAMHVEGLTPRAPLTDVPPLG